jgi:hypothetical protein
MSRILDNPIYVERYKFKSSELKDNSGVQWLTKAKNKPS